MPFRIHMGGKSFKFRNLDKDKQAEIKDKLAEKDPIMAQGNRGILPGIKINGEVVTQELVNKIDITKGAVISAPVVATPVIVTPKADVVLPDFTKAELTNKAKAIGLSAFSEWAKSRFNVTGKTSKSIIKGILAAQKANK